MVISGGIANAFIGSLQGVVPKFSIDYLGNVTSSYVDQGHTVPTNQILLPDQSSAYFVVSITWKDLQTDFTISFVSFLTCHNFKPAISEFLAV